MIRITIYTTVVCPFCVRAKRLLDHKGVAYEEVDVSYDVELREKMVIESGGRRTVPQIFIDGEAVGGYQELQALEDEGELDAILLARG
jgi:glutaredoxin 3